jgi:hypothetical protein
MYANVIGRIEGTYVGRQMTRENVMNAVKGERCVFCLSLAFLFFKKPMNSDLFYLMCWNHSQILLDGYWAQGNFVKNRKKVTDLAWPLLA